MFLLDWFPKEVIYNSHKNTNLKVVLHLVHLLESFCHSKNVRIISREFVHLFNV